MSAPLREFHFDNPALYGFATYAVEHDGFEVRVTFGTYATVKISGAAADAFAAKNGQDMDPMFKEAARQGALAAMQAARKALEASEPEVKA